MSLRPSLQKGLGLEFDETMSINKFNQTLSYDDSLTKKIVFGCNALCLALFVFLHVQVTAQARPSYRELDHEPCVRVFVLAFQ